MLNLIRLYNLVKGTEIPVNAVLDLDNSPTKIAKMDIIGGLTWEFKKDGDCGWKDIIGIRLAGDPKTNKNFLCVYDKYSDDGAIKLCEWDKDGNIIKDMENPFELKTFAAPKAKKYICVLASPYYNLEDKENVDMKELAACFDIEWEDSKW